MEITATTLPPHKYYPYTEVEFLELKEIVSKITTHRPNDRMGWVWENYRMISGDGAPQPCSCGSASGHWIKAVSVIKDFVNKVEANG